MISKYYHTLVSFRLVCEDQNGTLKVQKIAGKLSISSASRNVVTLVEAQMLSFKSQKGTRNAKRHYNPSGLHD